MPRALAQVLRPKRVLDVGCAKGFHILFFRRIDIEAFGVNISRYVVEKAPLEVKNYLSGADCEYDDLPFPDSYFDLVTMFEVIEHMHDHLHVLKETNRVLTSSGKLFVTTTSPPGEGDPTHVHVYDRQTWLKIFFNSNFYETSESRLLASKVMTRYRLYLPFVIQKPKDLGRALVEMLSLLMKKEQIFLLVKIPYGSQ